MSFDPLRLGLFLGCFGCAALAGCSSPPPMPTTGNGELHQGTFVYGSATTDLPSGIALGADFDLRYDPTTPATPALTLEPNTSFFSVDAAGRFHAKRAGYGAVLVTNSDGAVVDFVNLRIKTIGALVIDGIDATTPLRAGETRSVSASAFDAAGEALEGTLTLEWESADEAIAEVIVTDTDRALGTATLRAIAAGATRIRVVSGASTGTVSITVSGS